MLLVRAIERVIAKRTVYRTWVARRRYFAAKGQVASIITKRSRQKSFRTSDAFCFSLRPGGIIEGLVFTFLAMDQDHRSAALGHAGFDVTRWSVVLEAAQSRAAGGPEALGRLCERYWPPLYAFARHRGFSPEDAQDLVQGFFEHLIQSRALGAVDQAKGRFRSFLLASFQNFAAMEHRRAETERR